MLTYILRRLLGMIPIIFLISVVVFTLAKFMPGDALTGKLDPHNSSPEYVAKQRQLLGLNDPIYLQYSRWIEKIVLHGDFGQSFAYKEPVSKLIKSRLPNTLLLAILSLFITYTLAFTMGRYSGKNPYGLGDYLISGVNYLGLGIPSFIGALFAILIFSFTLRWVPASGSIGTDVDFGSLAYFLSRLKHAILPSFILGTIATVSHTQFLRNDMIESSRKDYVRTARAKGTPESTIYNKHILRNSVIPVVTLLGFDIGNLLGGAIIIETIFTYPGIGMLFFEAVNGRDFSVVAAITLMLTALTLIGNLAADVLYGIVDPRIRLEWEC